MAYNEQLAARARAAFPADLTVEERKMFGGLAFMVNGHMSCGIVGDQFMVRIAPDQYDEALRRPHVQPMDFTGRPMRGFVYVTPEGVASEPALSQWIERGVAFASNLPPKEEASPKRPTKRGRRSR